MQYLCVSETQREMSKTEIETDKHKWIYVSPKAIKKRKREMKTENQRSFALYTFRNTGVNVNVYNYI